MSGGVDSSVAAYLLKQQGYYTEGLSFILWGSDVDKAVDNDNRDGTTNTCCCAASLNDAGATAAAIGIKHNLADVRLEFMQRVIEPFIESYGKGITPNPCVLCNQHVKFPYLLSEANSRGFDYIATGHYAVATSQPALMTATDTTKDQSYFLYVLSLDLLSRLKFPLGRWTKPRVRELAEELDLPCHKKPESQDICFVDNSGYRGFLSGYYGDIRATGAIVDVDGKTIGTHRGLFAYTVGQRRGIGIAARYPLYVIDMDTTTNTLIVGPKDFILKTQFTVDNINRLIPTTDLPKSVMVKFRSTMPSVPASMEDVEGSTAKNVILHTPQWAPARGQSAVFYLGNRVIGGGVIV
ncbi:MAG: tRNA 2-thiouridine(34) synthase MnmA [Nitrospirae bacterium]|nr:tRNA 2-thiouridine(34) synthase MnmA [Nitrospirota bacterium]